MEVADRARGQVNLSVNFWYVIGLTRSCKYILSLGYREAISFELFSIIDVPNPVYAFLVHLLKVFLTIRVAVQPSLAALFPSPSTSLPREVN